MQIVNWDIQYISPPPAVRYCKKCGKKTEYVCSGLFRVNAQRRYLDIWLIYKCSNCDSTWNMTIYSRINPKSLNREILEGFHSNNEELAMKYAMDTGLIYKNGAESSLPKYEISGPAVDFTVPVELHIKSRYNSQIKVSSVLRDMLNLSQNTFEQMLAEESIQSNSGLDLKKCKVQTEIVLLINKKSPITV